MALKLFKKNFFLIISFLTYYKLIIYKKKAKNFIFYFITYVLIVFFFTTGTLSAYNTSPVNALLRIAVTHGFGITVLISIFGSIRFKIIQF